MTWRPPMALLSLALVASIAATASARPYNHYRATPGNHYARVKTGHALVGVASWYDCAKKGQCSRSKITASGERFNPGAMTAAHRSLPFGTRVRVTNTRTGRAVVVRINDRGPFVGGRVIDLSKASAREIGISGVGRVTIQRP